MDKKDRYNRSKVNLELLFRYFNNSATDEEISRINEWLEESPEHKEFYNNASDLHETFVLEAPIELLEGKETKSAGKRRRVLAFVRRSLAYAAAVAAVCVLGYHLATDVIEEKKLTQTMNTVVVPAGKSMDYILSDGTTIKLNSGAKLQYPLVFAKDCREVVLEGEAYFEVAHNAAQPFVVRTFASDITVLGTEFNVNADVQSGTFSATLVEGSIKLSGPLVPGTEMIMTPNQTARISEAGFTLENKSEISWTKGILDISGLEFKELMKKMETAFGVKIIVQSEFPSGKVFTKGKIRISDGIDKALEVVGSAIEFKYEKDYLTDTIYIR